MSTAHNFGSIQNIRIPVAHSNCLNLVGFFFRIYFISLLQSHVLFSFYLVVNLAHLKRCKGKKSWNNTQKTKSHNTHILYVRWIKWIKWIIYICKLVLFFFQLYGFSTHFYSSCWSVPSLWRYNCRTRTILWTIKLFAFSTTATIIAMQSWNRKHNQNIRSSQNFSVGFVIF